MLPLLWTSYTEFIMYIPWHACSSKRRAARAAEPDKAGLGSKHTVPKALLACRRETPALLAGRRSLRAQLERAASAQMLAAGLTSYQGSQRKKSPSFLRLQPTSRSSDSAQNSGKRTQTTPARWSSQQWPPGRWTPPLRRVPRYSGPVQRTRPRWARPGTPRTGSLRTGQVDQLTSLLQALVQLVKPPSGESHAHAWLCGRTARQTRGVATVSCGHL